MYSPGTKLKTRPLIIESILGQGGFGLTYKARHSDFKFPVVLKTPNPSFKGEQNFFKYVQKFKQEGEILVEISVEDPQNIVRFSEILEEDKIPWALMDYIQGKNLYELVSQEGKIPEEKAINYIRPIAEALKKCHQAGIIHRDIRPRNIVVRDGSEIPVLIDFALAVELGIKSTSKPAYRLFSPWEQQTKGEKSPTLDIYALAASLYYLVTGETPTPSFMRKLENQELVAPKEINSSISDDLNLAILMGMAVEQKDRPQSIEEWLKLFPSGEKKIEKVELRSNAGVDYSGLEKLLAAGRWREADMETRRVMLEAANRKKEQSWFREEDIVNFPCADLGTVDGLWLKYSNAKFGFSVQKQIWESLGAGTSDEAEEELGDRLGWRSQGKWLYYPDLTFDLTAPEGHLPSSVGGGRWEDWHGWWGFFCRARDCNL
ncbi:MAG: serine/threonine-protein kinase [Cyanobacteriota bacterium]|nr:serine/threonine-protein kinase [Cyanobacteriota bacterium]